MNIEHEKDRTIRFEDLKVGDTFYYKEGNEKILYLKILDMYQGSRLIINAINLSYNTMDSFGEDDRVDKVTCKVVVV